MINEIHKRSDFQIPETGAVLGIDIGWATNDKTTSVCLLSWTKETAQICFSENMRFEMNNRDDAETVVRTAKAMAAGKQLLMIAIDGMVMPDLSIAPAQHRDAERALSRGQFAEIGKPGSTRSRDGQKLASQASLVAKAVAEVFALEVPTNLLHGPIIEAFPNAFLAALLNDDERKVAFKAVEAQREINKLRRKRRDEGISQAQIDSINSEIHSIRERSRLRHDLVKSDFYYELMTKAGDSNTLLGLIERLLPERNFEFDWEGCDDHDRRASLVCAVTSLCVATSSYCYVGNETEGAILLPPKQTENAVGLTKWVEDSINAPRRSLPSPPADEVWTKLAKAYLDVMRVFADEIYNDEDDDRTINAEPLRAALAGAELSPIAAIQIALTSSYSQFSSELKILLGIQNYELPKNHRIPLALGISLDLAIPTSPIFRNLGSGGSIYSPSSEPLCTEFRQSIHNLMKAELSAKSLALDFFARMLELCSDRLQKVDEEPK